jgi:prepilin-type N-terminal cleavage/methylation domain-containing protein
MDRIRRRMREERGFTLIELMVSAAIGSVIMLVAYGLMDATIRAFGDSTDRTEVASRGRIALDAATQALRSPVCLEPETSAVISADGSSIQFWSDTTGSDFRTGNPQPVVRELSVAGGVLTERVRATVGGAVTQQRELAAGVSQIGSTPYFRYWKLSPATTPPRRADVAVTTPAAATDLPLIARVSISFQVDPRSGGNAKSAAQFQNDVYIRSFDSALGVVRCTAR